MAFGLGCVIGPFLGGLLTEINYTLPALAATAFALINLVLIIFLLPETHLPSKHISIPTKDALNQSLNYFEDSRTLQCVVFA